MWRLPLLATRLRLALQALRFNAPRYAGFLARHRAPVVVLDVAYYGGVGGTERLLHGVLEAMPEVRFLVFCRTILPGGYRFAGPNVLLNPWGLLRACRVDMLVHVSGVQVPALARLAARRRIPRRVCFLIEPHTPIPASTTDVIVESDATRRQLPAPWDARATVGFLGRGQFEDVAPEPVEGLPPTFALTVFNPYGPIKGFDRLLEALPGLPVPLVMACDDSTIPFEDDPQRHAGPGFVVCRRLRRGQIRTLYERASAYICFSRFEGFAHAVLDAYLMDLPVYSGEFGIVTVIRDQPGVHRFADIPELLATFTVASPVAPRAKRFPTYDLVAQLRALLADHAPTGAANGGAHPAA
jgi:hypothetical protein